MIECKINDVNLRVYENGEIYLKKTNWRKATDKLDDGYKRIMLNGKNYQQHRIIYKAFNPNFDIDNPKLILDHINRVKNDNQLSNLRAITHQQNNFNRSNVKGYIFYKQNNKWRGHIMLNGKSICKYFDTEEEARDWREEQKKLLHIIN